MKLVLLSHVVMGKGDKDLWWKRKINDVRGQDVYFDQKEDFGSYPAELIIFAHYSY